MTIIPISAPRPSFRWLNLYDPADVLGWPLQPLSEGYRLLVEDRGVNVGHGVIDWLARNWNPLSHSCYWDDEAVIAPLAAMLTQLMR